MVGTVLLFCPLVAVFMPICGGFTPAIITALIGWTAQSVAVAFCLIGGGARQSGNRPDIQGSYLRSAVISGQRRQDSPHATGRSDGSSHCFTIFSSDQQ
jgi:hypothetical protein